MGSLGYIITFGLLMSGITLLGGVGLLLPDKTLKKLILPMVAFAAGSLWGGAFFHLIPMGMKQFDHPQEFFLILTVGFIFFFILEHFIHWHHCHRTDHKPHKKPIGHLILVADGIHNFVGGLSIGSLFVIDIRMGIAAWTAAALHEIPQEIGDFGLLIHSGWTKKQAMAFNFVSSLTFLGGGVLAYHLSSTIDLSYLVPFTAGNFIYIVAADLIPELIQYQDMKHKLVSLMFFIIGLGILFLTHIH